MRNISIMKKLIYALILCILTASLCSCAKKNTSDEQGLSVYYINNDKTGIVLFPILDEKAGIDEMIDLLSTPSDKALYIAPIEGNVHVKGYELSDRNIWIDLDEGYRSLDPVYEILVRASIVRTLTQLEDVDTVSFTLEGEGLIDAAGAPIGPMSGEQFILNAGKEINAYENSTLILYFADDDGKSLKKVERSVIYSSNIPIDKVTVEELIKGITEGENAYPIINPSTKVISTTVNDGVCYVNLDPNFLIAIPTVDPEVTIYGLVNSLVEIPGINRVMISVDGSGELMYLEKIDLSKPFERNLEIVDQ